MAGAMPPFGGAPTGSLSRGSSSTWCAREDGALASFLRVSCTSAALGFKAIGPGPKVLGWFFMHVAVAIGVRFT